MTVLNKLKENKPLLLDTFYQHDRVHRLFLEKCYFPQKDAYQYFLKLYSHDINGNYNCEGYLYFYLDEETRSSSYIGTYIKKEYRGFGFASLLVAYWLHFGLENGYYHFTTNKKQRKPFLLYILKKYGFELPDISDYENSNYTIYLYQKKEQREKYLLFKSPTHAKNFLSSTIADEDNYRVITRPSDDYSYLDQVLQSSIYETSDESDIYTRSRRKIEQVQR